MSGRGPEKNVKARFLKKVRVAPTDACWEWLGGRDMHGYGKFTLQYTTYGAHRFGYRLLVGEIPVGMQIDHECHNADLDCNAGKDCRHRACVNPAHLVPKPAAENTLAGRTAPALNAAKTHCPQGHAYDDRSTYSGRSRYCRACHRDRSRQYKAAMKAGQS